MVSQAPQIRVKVNSPIGNDIFFALPDLTGNNKSFLDADVSSGTSSLSMNGTFFSVNDYIIVGQPGQSKCEIVKVSMASSTTVDFTPTLSFSHNRGDVVTLIEYNQIEPSRSTDGGTTFAALTIIDINPQSVETYLARTGDATTDVYKFRFYNAQTTLYSGYSDSIVATGYADNSVYAVKRHALSQMGEKLTDLITNDFLNDAINEARRVVDMGTATVEGIQQRVLRWSFRTKFNVEVGQIIPGHWSITAPTDLRDRNTYKNILSLRIGRSNWPCIYQDRRRFNQNYLNVGHTTLNGDVTVGNLTITLTSSAGFDTTGNISIAAEDVAGSRDIVAYTANDKATDTISGVTGIAENHATGNDVWQQATFGMPTAYNINGGIIYFDVPFDDSFKGQPIYMDYYTVLTEVNSDADVLDEPFYDLYVPYVKWKIKSLKSNGALKPTDDGDYLLFQQGLAELVSQEVTGQFVFFTPDIWGNLSGGYGGRGWY